MDIGAYELNRPPSVQAGNTQTVFSEGESLTLGVSASSDPDGDALTFGWDVNGDGVFDDATGANPTLTWEQLVALGIDNGLRTLRVRVFDGSGQSSTSEAKSVELRNVAPSIVITGDTSDRPEGTAINLGVTITDPSPTETFTYDWQIMRDGVSYASGTDATFAFTPTTTAPTR